MKSNMLFSLACLLFSVGKASVTISFRVRYPKTSFSLYLRGNGCGLSWDKGVKLTPIDDETWGTSVTCDGKSSNLEVKALLEDVKWMIGANHHVSLQNVSTVDDTFFPWFSKTKGTLVTVKNVFSKELSNTRDVILYLPPSFEENTLKTYDNILIMHDGQNLFDPKTSAFGAWMCQDALDSSIVSGKMDEVIVVGAYNTVDRNNEYTYIYDASEGFGGKGDLYLDWIEATLIPLITPSTYRANVKRETLGILGSSLGGLISCYAGWTRPHVYGKVGCMSSSFWWDDNDYQNNVMIDHAVPEAPKPRFYMDSGTGSVGEAECTAYTSQIKSLMIQDGFSENVDVMTYVQQGGKHNEASWGSRFDIPLQFLYPAETV